MATKSQKKATRNHRRRAVARGLVRVEVQARKADAGLIKSVARTLRADTQKATGLRRTLESALRGGEQKSIREVFRSDLPDSAFDGVFDQPRRPDDWRKSHV